MKSIILLAFLLIFFTSCNNKNTEAEIKVLSFNIRYGLADDGQNSWEFRKDIVMETIKRENAGIMGLQEALDFQMNEILDNFPKYKYIGVGRDDGKSEGEFSSILYDKELYKVLDSGTFWLSDFPDSVGSKTWGNTIPRICTWGKFEQIDDKRKFYVYNVHYDHQSQESRVNASILLMKKVEEVKENFPVILMGDFNAGEDNSAIRIIKKSFVDTYRMAHPKSELVGTFNYFKGVDNEDKIDYVFINEKFDILNAEIVKFNIDDRYPSDHFPVSATLALKK